MRLFRSRRTEQQLLLSLRQTAPLLDPLPEARVAVLTGGDTKGGDRVSFPAERPKAARGREPNDAAPASLPEARVASLAGVTRTGAFQKSFLG